MATITPLTLTPITERTGGTVVGQVAASFTPAGGGDNVLATGTWLGLEFSTSGTAVTVTMDSVELSSYGTDVNPTIVLAATDHQKVLIYVPDQRFLQPAGASVPGSVGLTYSAVTGLTARAWTIA
jgi:hypothetical protein